MSPFCEIYNKNTSVFEDIPFRKIFNAIALALLP